jgi:outer membrane receptor protein involved in Fe transport
MISDVNGNPVYVPNAGATSPVLRVHRSGFYQAAYVQDTWKASRLTVNYGLRYDHFRQAQTLGQSVIDKTELSPRLNLSYALAKQTVLRTSADHLFNIPPLAQGAVVGQPIQPESLNQYDVSIEKQIAPGQTTKAAYYYKQIHNQVDTGLLIPGSQIGLYSAVNFQYGGVHGIELSYDVSPPSGVGLDGYLNYSYSIAKPNGFDNTGVHVPEYNDHDQRQTVGAGIAYLFKGGASAALTLNYGSGLASSPIPPSPNRIPRTEVDLRATTNPHLIAGHGGIGIDVTNLFDDRSVINFQSAFSGTRFVQARRVLLSTFFNF